MIKLRFRIHLENYAVFEKPGVLFNQWLPDGPTNAIDVPVTHKANKLQIWFERKGFLEGGFIRYNSQRSEVDPDIMSRQGKLEAGPLRGQALFTNISKAELKALKDNLVGNEDYIALGKRIIEFLYPPLSNFISVLRTQYGQYWLWELHAWDSRKQSLGGYCRSTLGLEWSEDENQWSRFAPTELNEMVSLPELVRRGFKEYLTKDDWERLSASFNPSEAPSLAVVVLGRAHEFYDAGEWRQSYIEGVTALEAALNEFVKEKLKNNTELLQKALTDLFEDSKKGVQDKFFLVSSISGLISDDVFNETIAAIKIRNDIVHGRKFKPDASTGNTLLILLETVTKFLRPDEYKFPMLINGNRLDAP